jgi:AcrR family transcriptional regulator
VGVAERREREREQLRNQIVEAARDLLLEQGLTALSMRAIAERIEYSPATIYLYFRDKDELIREVVRTGFTRLHEVIAGELSRLGETAGPALQYRAMGRAYARFAIENASYFRVMYELPSTAQYDCAEVAPSGDCGLEMLAALVQRGVEAGQFGAVEPRRTALIGWGLVHGLTTLYLSGHLRQEAPGPDAFIELIEAAMESIYAGWRPELAGGEVA